MAIRHDDGQFGLDCWIDEDDESEPASEFSDNQQELRERAEVLLRGGKYRYLVLSRWNPDLEPEGDWVEIATFEPDE